MRFSDILHFSESDYYERIREKGYSAYGLAREIYTKRRKANGAKGAVVSSVVCAHVTGGLSLLGGAYAGRNLSVEHQKLKLLEQMWGECTGGHELPHRHFRDTIIPIVISTALCYLTFTVDLNMTSFAANAAYANQIGMSSYIFPSHIVGAEATGAEKSLGWVGRKVNYRL